MYRSTEVLDGTPGKVRIKTSNSKKKIFFSVSVFLFVVGVAALTTTTILLVTKDGKNESQTNGVLSECKQTTKDNSEAREVYKKIRDKYNELHLDALLRKENGVSIQPAFLNFTPSLYRERTQATRDLLGKLEKVKSTLTFSKEEDLTFELFRRFLVNTFGKPYENNYETGDWLLGPNIFCWQDSCMKLGSLGKALKEIKPRTMQDIELMADLMKKCSEGYKQRVKNLKYGISAGIVLPDVACQAGLQNFKRVHVEVAKNGARGIFEDWYIAELLDPSNLNNIPKEDIRKWNEKYNVSFRSFLKDNLLNHVGKSLHNFIRYLEEDYSTHCPPSNVASGFASLPIPYVYTNGSPDFNKPTTGRLPGGEKYNGSAAYLTLLAYFTTYNITPKEVDELANKKLKELFPQIVKIAKARTNENDESEAIKKFRLQLESDEYFYKIENETQNSDPYLECYDDETAQKYCPERWEAMNRWLQSARANLNILRTKMKRAFYITGEKTLLPNCPIKMNFDYGPANPFHSYREGSVDCSSLAGIYMPFFLQRLGPKYEEMTVMAHEAYPGHHLEVQGVNEHRPIKCDALKKWVSEEEYFPAFSEGWATYIEKDVADLDMKLYKNDMERYGMLKHQILAALRAKVDVGVHFFGMKRQDAILLYEKYALDTSNRIQKEITRLQSGPGQGTAYMVGEAKFSEYREKASKKLGAKFNIRDFHFEVLRHGELPMLYLGKHIDEYIERELATN